MTRLCHSALLGLLLGVLACTPTPDTDPVAPSTPAPDHRRYNPEELALSPAPESAANREM